MAIIETSKIIVELAKKGMTIELQEKIMQLREEALELQEENLSLKTENIKLKKKEELRGTVQFENNFVYQVIDDQKLGPCCPRCFDKEQKLARLVEIQNRAYGCSICKFILTREGQGLQPAERAHLINTYLK